LAKAFTDIKSWFNISFVYRALVLLFFATLLGKMTGFNVKPPEASVGKTVE
jgi:hypothetical protein